MISYWIVRHRETGEERLIECDGHYPRYDEDLFEIAELPRPLATETERWDWSNGEIVVRLTAAQARDGQWSAVKAYRDEDRYFWTLPVPDVVPDATIMVQCDGKSRVKVSDLAQAATWATMRGEALAITFTDADNIPFTVDAEQTIAIKAAVTRNDARCHAASQVLRAQLDAAVADETPAADILAIDVIAVFEAILAAGQSPQEPES